MDDCAICCSPIEKLASCHKCKKDCCNDCYQIYISSCKNEPKCMFCGEKVGIFDIQRNSDGKWFVEVYREERIKNLYDLELPHVNSPQLENAKKAYFDAFRILAEAPLKDTDIRTTAEICIHEYGAGWETYGFFTDDTSERPNMVRYKCSSGRCDGIVAAGSCNICGVFHCDTCHEIRKADHKCNPNIVKSINTIGRHSKSCPKCLAPIQKSEGCDQMFCVECHATFSYNTGRLIRGNEFFHNPLHIEWLNRGMPERIYIDECEVKFVSHRDLLTCFIGDELEDFYNIKKKKPAISKFNKLPSIGCYILALTNIRASILNIQASSGNHANISRESYKLRMQLLTNELTREEFKKETEEDDYKYQKAMCFWEVYSTIFEISKIIFENLFSYTHRVKNRRSVPIKSRIDYFESVYLQLMEITARANEKIIDYQSIFNDERMKTYISHPFTDPYTLE